MSAVLHDAVERMVSQGLYEDVTNAAVTHATTDRVSATVGSRKGKFTQLRSRFMVGFEEEKSTDNADNTLSKTLIGVLKDRKTKLLFASIMIVQQSCVVFTSTRANFSPIIYF